MKILALFVFILLTFNLCAQKPNVTLDTYKKWKSVSNGSISNDGAFVMYSVNDVLSGQSNLILKSVNGIFEKIFNAIEANFSADSKRIVGRLNNDTLFVYNIYDSSNYKVPGVIGYELLNIGDEELVLYRLNDQSMVFFEISSRRKWSCQKVIDYKVLKSKKSVLIVSTERGDTSNAETLKIVDLVSKKERSIFKGFDIKDLITDTLENRIAFFDTKDGIKSIWCHNIKTNHLDMIVNESNNSLDSTIRIKSINFKFSSDGINLFFSLVSKVNIERNPVDSLVEIWSFEDSFLKSQYRAGIGGVTDEKTFLSKVNISNHKILQLLHDNEKLSINNLGTTSDSYLLVESSYGRYDEPFMKCTKITYSICSVESGKMEKIVGLRDYRLSMINFSPSGRILTFYDPEFENYFSYEMRTRRKYNITKGIKSGLLNLSFSDYVRPNEIPAGIIGWLQNDEKFLIRGKFDIWMVDPLGNGEPINITQETGDNGGIVFNFASKPQPGSSGQRRSNNIILTGFDLRNKNFGFYGLDLSGMPKLIKLYSGRFCLSSLKDPYTDMPETGFLKAGNANAYLILRQSAEESPNYYYSKNLKEFFPVSSIRPELEYNWLTSELHSYKDSIGNEYQGILFKPQDFNPNRKYPVIFRYYEKESNTLNLFRTVDPVGANFNILIAVGKGYLVFLPDMVSKVGHVGDGAVNSVLAAVDHLSQYKWIDTSRIGICGHSFGGFETNFIITRSNKFKAAISSSGNSEVISMAYETVGASGPGKQFYYQYYVPKMGYSLPDSPQIYLTNSPLLKASSVNTPLLLVHNTADGAVPFRQSKQFFMLLRSLNKPVWFLNYKNEEHVLENPANQVDLNNKVFDFFNYYLKDNALPKWMKEHI